MKNKKDSRYLFWSRVLNPVALTIYGVACFYLYSLCQYGGVKRRMPIIIICMGLLSLWFLWCVYSNHKHEKKSQNMVLEVSKEKQYDAEKDIRRSKLWYSISCFILVGITGLTALGVYNSAVNYNGKLSWLLQDLKNKRQVEYIESNIYEHGLQGIFDAIETRLDLPKDLYVLSDFILKFNKDGTILSFDTFLYGRNEEGETESFLITYDDKKSKKITVYLRGNVNADYDDIHKFQPLLDAMKVIPLKDTILQWEQEEFGILYAGIRNWGYNTAGIVTIDKEGNVKKEEYAMNEIVGYTISVYVPEKEDMIIPVRYIPDWETVMIEPEMIKKNNVIGYRDFDGEEAFFLDETRGYRLTVADAALGSRFYILDQTQDAGLTWQTLNKDPFSGDAGASAGITFLDEKLGFIAMSHSGGSYGELYRTEDGGVSYKKISFPPVKVPLNENETYEAFDFPGMPYLQDEKLEVLVGQGQDGDYKGGIKALYQSLDRGNTWEYVGEADDK